MLKVYRNIKSYNSDKGDFFNWTYTIVRNTVLDKLKLLKFPATKELWADMKEEDGNPLKMLEWKDVYKLPDTLAPATRAVCSLFYMEGFSINDISDRLQISAGT